ncbi:MAG: response regulator [bacterium]|nr:response regulator [bacterium]
MNAVRALIVEDEPHLAGLLARAFAQEGWQTAVARNGIEGLNQVASFRPDVIVMDIMMPKLDGIDATRLIRRNPGHDRTAIVALSARCDRAARAEMLEAGADLFLEKPFVMSRLVAQAADALAARRVPAGKETL